jgi:spermidine synthase
MVKYMSRLVGFWRANSSSPAISPRASVNWVMLIYFASGVCALIDEVVWVRLLKLTLGNTVYATSIVVSVFMGGLALGALIMGRFADRIAGRLRLYALLETIITVSALSLPFALKLVDTFYVWFYRTYGPSHTQLLFVQVVISAAILLVPSILMGSTLPLLGRFITALEKEAGHLVGKLYALNTLGAAAGCFLAGFVLIRALGVMGSLYTAAALNLLVAFGGWLLSRFPGAAVEQKVEPLAVERPDVISAKPPLGRFYLLIAAFFMSGLISIGYELLWMRSIVHLLGGFTYVFSAVLTIYLLGNVIGAGIGSRIVKRLKRPAVGFAVTLSLLGLCGIFYLPLLILWTSKVLPYVNQALKAMYSWMPFPSYIVGILVQSVFLFLVPAVIMGIGFPVALQAWANYMHKVGRSTGTAYGANTIGAVVGGVATGFVLIPLLGVQISISILGLAGIWIAGVMCLLFARGSKVLGRLALLGLAVIFTVVTLKAPSDLFSTVIKINPLIPGWELLCVKEGVTTAVSLHREPNGKSLQLHSSGQSIAGDGYVERGDQKMLGHLAILLNSDAKEVLSVGFGSGETTACLAAHNLDRVDCVEIAPEVVKVALQFFRHINLGDRLNDEVNMIYMDAKNYLHLTDKSYDVIINDSIHPRDFAENASLYTKEYFEGAKQHLKENGMIISWLPVYDMPASVFNSIIGTMLDVFPHVTLWYLTPHPAPLVLIAGSEQPQYFSPKHIKNELLKEGVRDSISEIGIQNSVDVLSCYIGDENDLRKHITSFSLNSDYFPFVEFTTDDKTPQSQILKRFVMDVRSESVYDHIDWTGFSQEQKDKWLTAYQQLYRASTYLLMAYTTEDSLLQLKYSIDGLAILPDSPGLLHSREEAEKLLFSSSVGMILSGNPNDALVLAGRILEIYPESAMAWMIRSGAMQGGGNMEKALIAAQQAVVLAPDNADAHLNLGGILFRVSQFDKAVTEYRESLRLKPDQHVALEMLAEVLIIDEKADFYNPTEAVRLAERACELTGYENVQLLDTLASAYAAAGRLPDAIATAERAFDLASSAGQKEMAEHISNRLLLFKAARTPSQQH